MSKKKNKKKNKQKQLNKKQKHQQSPVTPATATKESEKTTPDTRPVIEETKPESAQETENVEALPENINNGEQPAEDKNKEAETTENNDVTAPEEETIQEKVPSAIREKFKKIYAFTKDKFKEICDFLTMHKKISIPVGVALFIAIISLTTLGIERAVWSYQVHLKELEAQKEAQARQAYMESIRLKQDVATDINAMCTVMYKGVKFGKNAEGENSNGFGIKYENHDEGYTYMDVRLSYTNKSGNPVRADKAAILTSSEYVSFPTVEQNEGKDLQSASEIDIQNGETVILHYLFSVPEELEKSGDAIEINAVINNKAHPIKVR